jgi:hypothetical protein
VRAVEVLEWIGDDAARKALAKLAEEGGALLKQEAGRALKRLGEMGSFLICQTNGRRDSVNCCKPVQTATGSKPCHEAVGL